MTTHPPQDAPRVTYSVPDVAAMLGVSERTVRNLVAGNEIESLKIGKRRLVSRRALDRFIEAKEQEQAR